MNKATKRGCVWGCGLATLMLVAIAGVGTWYASRMNQDFKQVKTSEEVLVQAVSAQGPFTGDLVHPPTPDRIAAFLRVRRGLQEWRQNLERSVGEFKAAHVEARGGIPKFFKSLRAGTELAPVYAGFWQKRNELLLEQKMGPQEYTYLYRLIFYTWLRHDPRDGAETPAGTALVTGKTGKADAHAPPPLPAPVWAGDPSALEQALAPFGQALSNTYSPVLNPLEVLFVATAQVPGPAK